MSKTTKEKFNFKNMEEWQTALNAAPSDNWVKERSFGGNRKSYYLPIPIQQALADIFFNEFDVVDAKFEQIINEILCTVKISILPSYPNSEHRIISGSGAKPIQCSSGSAVHKFPVGKITNSLEYCSPAARASAISNSLSTFANVFGRNLGRAVSTDFNLSKNKRKT